MNGVHHSGSAVLCFVGFYNRRGRYVDKPLYRCMNANGPTEHITVELGRCTTVVKVRILNVWNSAALFIARNVCYNLNNLALRA